MERREDIRVSNQRVEWAPWSPAQFVALGIGVIFILLAVITLAQTGLNVPGFLQLHVIAIGLHQTGLLAVVELLMGLLLILAGVTPGASRGTMSFVGVVALAAGLLFLIQPSLFHGALGVHEGNGWFFTITAAVLLIAAMVAPIIMGRDRRVSGQSQDVVYRD